MFVGARLSQTLQNMLTQDQLERPPSILKDLTEGIIESREQGLVVLSPAHKRSFRRVIYVDTYGGGAIWEKIKKGLVPSHHLRGCLQLVRMGYEVALAEPLDNFYFSYRRIPLPHDLKFFQMVRSWLGPEGIIFCGHNVLYWIPLLRVLGALRCRVVSNLWAREDLNFSRSHSGIIALTQAAAEQARKLAPNVKVAHLGWGADLTAFPRLEYNPEAFLSCGITLRDFHTLSNAAARCSHSLRVICPGLSEALTWSSNVQLIDGGRGWNADDSKKLTFQQLLHEYYARSAGSLIIVKKDPTQSGAIGCTELLEVLAMARPVILTRTGALPTEIDVEKAGCGLFVPPEDPGALAEAIEAIGNDPKRAEAMGQKGRELVERYYNIERFANDLHKFFESL